MALSAVYNMPMWGMVCLVILVIAQWLVATVVKASQPGAVPGKIDENLSHDSFVFRAHRTYMNTLENLPAVLLASFIAFLIGANPLWLGGLIWLYVAARVVHMALYYAIATERNPSPRSYFFMLGFLANLGLVILCVTTLLER